jgi:hypothetical protein
MNLTKFVGAVALVAICCTISACSNSPRYRTNGSIETAQKHGPPPHAPAHGYRHKHHNEDLKYDSVLEVYVMSGWPNYYYHKDHYYRSTDYGWETAGQLRGPWKSVSTKKLPKGLRNSDKANDKKSDGKKADDKKADDKKDKDKKNNGKKNDDKKDKKDDKDK